MSSYSNYLPSQLPAELMFRDAQIKIQLARIQRLETRVEELEKQLKEADAQVDDSNERVNELSDCVQALTEKDIANERKFGVIEERNAALKKAFDEGYDEATGTIADREAKIEEYKAKYEDTKEKLEELQQRKANADLVATARIVTLTMEIASIPRPQTPAPHPPFSPLTPPPRIQAAPGGIRKKRAPRVKLVAPVLELQRSGRSTRFRGSYKI